MSMIKANNAVTPKPVDETIRSDEYGANFEGSLFEWYQANRPVPDDLASGLLLGRDFWVWYENGYLHREDGPALKWFEDFAEWYQNGLLHRVDGPARIDYEFGGEEWFLNGKRHRLHGPAVTHRDGTREWWINGERQPEPEIVDATDGSVREIDYNHSYHKWLRNGKHRANLEGLVVVYGTNFEAYYLNDRLHRVDEPALVVYDEHEEWHLNGALHRDDDEPAITWYADDIQEWFTHGQRHREEHPAVLRFDSVQWFINGEFVPLISDCGGGTDGYWEASGFREPLPDIYTLANKA